MKIYGEDSIGWDSRIEYRIEYIGLHSYCTCILANETFPRFVCVIVCSSVYLH